MVTYNKWAIRATRIAKYYVWIYPFTLCFLTIASLGIMNLVTGVMVQAAFQFVQEDVRKKQDSLLSKTRDIITEALENTFEISEESVVQGKMALSDQIRHYREDIAGRNEASPSHSSRPITLASRARKFSGSYETSGLESPGTGSKEIARPSAPRLSRRGSSVTSSKASAYDESTVVKAAHWCLYCEAYNGTPQAGQAVYNLCNSCVVTHVTWIGLREVAVAFAILEDGSVGPDKDPMRSYLSWDGGMKGPEMLLPYSGFLAPPGVMEEDLLVPPIGWGDGGEVCIGERGVLVFSDVRHGQVLTFRFGGNYPTISFVGDDPGKSAHTPAVGAGEDEEAAPVSKLADLYPVDRSVISLREVGKLLQDGAFVKNLAAVDLRPEEVLMVFQNLNVTGSGRVKVDIFVEGLLRMKRPLNGIDVANAKSLMRRLIMEITDLAGMAKSCNACFAEVVEKFRHIQILDRSDMHGQGNKVSDLDHDVVHAEQLVLEEENQGLRRRIALLKKHVKKRQALLRVDGDLAFEARFRRDSMETAADVSPTHDDDVASLCSLGPGGWD